MEGYRWREDFFRKGNTGALRAQESFRYDLEKGKGRFFSRSAKQPWEMRPDLGEGVVIEVWARDGRRRMSTSARLGSSMLGTKSEDSDRKDRSLSGSGNEWASENSMSYRI